MTRYAPLWLQAQSYAAGVDRRLIGALWPAARADGLAVSSAGAGMDLNVAAGSCAIPAANGTGSVLCASDAVETVTLEPAPPSGTNRIDLVICQSRGADIDGGPDNDFVFAYTKGAEAPAGSETVPATPPGAIALASVKVAGGAATVAPADITDVRPSSLAVGVPASYPRGYIGQVMGPPSAVTASSTPVTVVTITIQAVAGRWYRADLQYNLQKITNNGGTTRNSLIDSQGASNYALYALNTQAGQVWVGNTWIFTKANATGPLSFRLDIACDNASVSAAANAQKIYVQDIGTG
jgi:hypothetical protein